MANEDSFIAEVSEEVRRDRLYALMRKYGWIAILVVVLLVGGAALNEWRKSSARAEAEAAGDAILSALEAEGADERAAAVASLESGDNAGRAALIRLMQAAAEADAEDYEAARTTLDALAANSETPALYRDLAILKSVILSAKSADPADRIARLEGLAVAGAPYRLLALEQIALAEIERGGTEAALATLREVLTDSQITQGLRRRVSQLIVALGGSLTAT